MVEKETCQNAKLFDEPHKTEYFWGVETSKEENVGELGLYTFVEYFHVFLRVTCDTARGLQCRERPAKDG